MFSIFNFWSCKEKVALEGYSCTDTLTATLQDFQYLMDASFPKIKSWLKKKKKKIHIMLSEFIYSGGQI